MHCVDLWFEVEATCRNGGDGKALAAALGEYNRHLKRLSDVHHQEVLHEVRRRFHRFSEAS